MSQRDDAESTHDVIQSLDELANKDGNNDKKEFKHVLYPWR